MNGGKGSLREMHRADIAAGTVDEVSVDDDGYTRVVCSVVDEGSIRKLRKGVLRGLSVGGRVLKRDEKNSKIITKVSWSELSLVDRPCCSEAIILAKAAPAAPLSGLHSITGDPMSALTQLSPAELEALVQQLPQSDRALLQIYAIMVEGRRRI